jgi:hypothetical protein
MTYRQDLCWNHLVKVATAERERMLIPRVIKTASVDELDKRLDPGIVALYTPLIIGPQAPSAAKLSASLLVGAAAIRSAKAELDELRVACNQEDDLTTDIDYFLSWNDPRNCRPIVLILRVESRAMAAVLLHEVCFFWCGTGLWRAGDSSGECILIARAEERETALRRAIDELVNVQKRFHTLRLCIKTANSGRLIDYEAFGISSKLVERTVKHTLPLASSYTDMLAKFGLRTRRSLRTKRRQLEDTLRPTFFSGLAPEPAFDAMRYLRSRSSSPTRSLWYFESRRTFLRSRADAFAMALRSCDGIWLSVLSGWRRNGITYVDMQLNHSAFKRESLSAVMRAFLLENEIGAGQKAITFVGGCSALLERYCNPNETVVDLLVTRFSIRAWCVKRVIRSFCDSSFGDCIYM